MPENKFYYLVILIHSHSYHRTHGRRLARTMRDVTLPKRVGVTHAIRAKLNFLDERLWKRFSARRLELIDTLDLSSRKASEQEEQIQRVAEELRIEFKYPVEYFFDFDKLVRAAVQSVRRNRKRSSKSGQTSFTEDDSKRRRIADLYLQTNSRSTSPAHETHTTFTSPDVSQEYVGPEKSEMTGSMSHHNQKFISEISRLNSDSQEDVYDMNYPRGKHFSISDKSRVAIDSMIQPRINHTPPPTLPPISNISFKSASEPLVNTSSRPKLLNYIERSKTCSESISKRSENLEFLGKAVIASCIAYVLEKSFSTATETLMEYLRSKLNQEQYLANFYKELDPTAAAKHTLTNEIATLSLYTLLGSCVKDFGFDRIMLTLCECFYGNIIKDYPLISQQSVVFNGDDHRSYSAPAYSDPLSSLATVASEMTNQNWGRKAVTLRFLASVLEFTYPIANSAPPKLIELTENAKSAFKLTATANQAVIKLRNTSDGSLVSSDSDVESLFKTPEKVELEIITEPAHSIPINELTSTVRSSRPHDPKIILPPPFHNRPFTSDPITHLAHQARSQSNTPPFTPTPSLLPVFQPLL